MYEVIFYGDKRGRYPADEFLDDLQPKIRAKVEKWMEKLEEEGPNLPRRLLSPTVFKRKLTESL